MTDQSNVVPARRPGAPARSEATHIEVARAVAEVQAMVTVAQARPRDMAKAVQLMQTSCARLTLAEGAFFSFNRGGQTVAGPTIKLATELARCWGNINHGVRELSRDDVNRTSEMMAFGWDLESNMRADISFIVPHMRDKKGGAVPLLDMRDIYENNANNAARRLREMIFRALPPWFVEEAKALCHATLQKGDGVDPVPVRVAKLLKMFGDMGINRERIEARLGGNADKMTVVDLANLGVVFRSLERGETSKEEEFPTVAAADVERTLATKPDGNRTPPPSKPPVAAAGAMPRNWRPNTTGQEATTKAILELVELCESDADFEALEKANVDRLKIYTASNRQKIEAAIAKRREELK